MITAGAPQPLVVDGGAGAEVGWLTGVGRLVTVGRVVGRLVAVGCTVG